MKDDKLLMAGVIGGLSTLFSELSTQLLIFFGFGRYSIYSLSSMLITINRPSLILGTIISTVVGGFSAILFYYSLIRFGSNYIIVKSIALSILLWIALETFFTMYIEVKYIPLRPLSSYSVHLVGAVIFGISVGVSFNKFLFSKHIKGHE